MTRRELFAACIGLVVAVIAPKVKADPVITGFGMDMKGVRSFRAPYGKWERVHLFGPGVIRGGCRTGKSVRGGIA